MSLSDLIARAKAHLNDGVCPADGACDECESVTRAVAALEPEAAELAAFRALAARVASLVKAARGAGRCWYDGSTDVVLDAVDAAFVVQVANALPPMTDADVRKEASDGRR